jgi:hypothetical protein
MTGIVTVDSEVPFGRTLYARLYLKGLHLDDLVRHDRIEEHYLAWETVRKARNPYFLKGTGFEGYLIGCCPNSEAALEKILSISQNMLDSIVRLYRYQYGFRSRLMKTLLKEQSDDAAIHIWSAYLGGELGKLRASILHDKMALAFRNQTYDIVETLPPMVYREVSEDVTQTYAVGLGDGLFPGRLRISLNALKPGQQDAWLVAENIGEFGHPLVRKLLVHG